jgi:hypothetical protein
MNKILALALIGLVVVAVLGYFILFFLRNNSPIPSTTRSEDYLVATDSSVIAYQITKDKNEVVFLTFEDGKQSVHLWNDISGQSTKLVTVPITTDSNAKISFAESYMDKDGNIIFEHAGNLILVFADRKVKVYKYLSENLLYTQDEFNNKTISRTFKKIIEKYSSTPITSFEMYANSDLTTYLLDVDLGYYIVSKQDTLSLVRFPLEGENVLTVKENDYLKVNYAGRWDAQLGKVDEQATIDTITETVRGEQIRLQPTTKYETDFPSLMSEDKVYQVVNDKHTGKLQHVCYPTFMNIDGPKCRAKRLFLSTSSAEYVLPNFDLKSMNTDYGSSFLYIPFNKRFFTDSGTFIFLSQDYKLYAFGK